MCVTKNSDNVSWLARRAGWSLSVVLGVGLFGCSSGQRGVPANRGDFKLTLASTGSGQILPARIRQLDAFGNPSDAVVNVDDLEVLRRNATVSNPVLPPATFSTAAVLPDGAPGNHFLLLRFSHALAAQSILSTDVAASANSQLTTAISLLAYNPVTEATVVVSGRGFVGGWTVVERGGTLQLQRAVVAEGDAVRVLLPEAEGFPRGFTGAADLVADNSFVFVADTDGNLSSFETLPRERLLRIDVRNAVLDSEGHPLEQEASTATTVSTDDQPADVLGFSGTRLLGMEPSEGATDVAPDTTLVVRFNKPVQPADVGVMFEASVVLPPARGLSIAVRAGGETFAVPYFAEPFSAADLCSYRVRPAWQLPAGSEVVARFAVAREQVHGLANPSRGLGRDAAVTFRMGLGTGLVNAPVPPEAMFVGLGGAEPGVCVIDLNGFGQGTGDPALSRWPLNPNIGQVGIDPPLSADPSRSAVIGGGAGVFTFTQDSRGRQRLLDRALIGTVGDIQIGCPLDLVYNDESRNRYAARSNQTNPLLFSIQVGNNITTAPHPNPPRLDLVNPSAPERGIYGERPTRTSSSGPAGTVLVTVPPCLPSPINQLVAGNPFARERSEVGIFGGTVQGVFNGPQPPPPSPPVATPYCPFTSRQQIGHFLYVVDRDNRQLLVLNSNRFTVLDRIRLTDPVDMAMSPNLRRLAVSNFASSTVTILDIDPLSSRFHQVITEVRVPRGPSSLAWQPDGEDLFVVCAPSNAVAILGGRDFAPRRVLGGLVSAPIDVVVTERFAGTGNQSGVYYAYVLNGNGTIAVYESGPDGVNGIGFNDVVGLVQGNTFRRASKLLHDYTVPNSGVLVAHVDEAGVGQVSRLELTSTPVLPQQLQQNGGGNTLPPTFRQKDWTVTQRIGGMSATTPVKDQLSGNAPVDLALDEVRNVGALPDQLTVFNQALQPTPMGHSGKAVVKSNQVGTLVRAASPRFLFVALADSGRVDVFGIDSGQRVATLIAPGVRVVSGYWRQ